MQVGQTVDSSLHTGDEAGRSCLISSNELSSKSSVGWTLRQNMAKKTVLKDMTEKEVGDEKLGSPWVFSI